MKAQNVSKPFIALLVTGLMMTTVSPLVARHFHWSDAMHGFVVGMGIGLELLAIVFLMRNKKAAASKLP